MISHLPKLPKDTQSLSGLSLEWQNRLKSIMLAFVLIPILLFSPADADAARRSGGRMGGGSIRQTQRAAPRQSASQFGSTSSFGGTSSPSLRPNVIVSPFGGFGYSPFGMMGGFSPMGMGMGYGARPLLMGPSITDVVIVGGVAFAGYKAYQKFMSGDEGGMGGGSAVQVSKLQVSLSCDERGPNSLLGTMSRLADTCDTDSQRGICNLVSDTALALLRREGDWSSASLTTAKASGLEDGESKFGKFSLEERSKIDRETVNKVRGQDKSDTRGEGDNNDVGRPTVAVVTLILATQGRELQPVKDLQSLRSCLSTLGSDALDSYRYPTTHFPDRSLECPLPPHLHRPRNNILPCVECPLVRIPWIWEAIHLLDHCLECLQRNTPRLWFRRFSRLWFRKTRVACTRSHPLHARKK